MGDVQDLLTLDEACRIPPLNGKVKAATLRAAAARGELVLVRIGRADFTTPADVNAWVQSCREKARVRTSGSDQPAPAAPPPGSFSTGAPSSPQAAALTIVQGLKAALPPTSSRGNGRKGRATLIASR